MNIRIIAVGKLKEKYLKDGIAEYVKRLGPYCKLSIIEIQDEPVIDGNPAQHQLARAKEGERLLKAVKTGAWVVALDVKGKMLSSEDFAQYLEELCVKGKSDVCFLIGGASGFDSLVLARCNYRISFSPMTFPHQLARLLLVEQLYRTFKIRRGEPYHCDD